jgi:phosphate-selective porin OprO and OprP
MTPYLFRAGVITLVALACVPASAQESRPAAQPEPAMFGIAPTARLAVEVANGDADLSRRRVGVNGHIGTRVRFEIERELGRDRPWRDVFVEYRVQPALRIRGGQFKLPFSLEATTGAADLDFVYRSRAAAQLAPGRDQGVMAQGRVWSKRLEYEAGYFRRDGGTPSSTNIDRTYGQGAIAGRVALRPFASRKRGIADLHVAVALVDADIGEGVTNLRGRTVTGETFFPSDFWVAGRRRRTGLEARWRPGRLTVTAEYLRVADDRRGQGLSGDDLSPLVGSGWYVSGMWRLPRVAPRTRFEVGARVEGLTFGSGGSIAFASTNPRADTIASTADHAVTLGVNWFIGHHLKVQANAIRESLRVPDAAAAPVRSWTPVFSVQFGL